MRTSSSVSRFLAGSPIAPGSTADAVRAEMLHEFGLFPDPLALHLPLPDLLAAAWAVLRETVVVEHALPRRAKEAMAVAISRANDCPYCVDAHGVSLHALGDGRVEKALRGKQPATVDPDLAALLAWTIAAGTAAGARREPPFPPAARAEAVGTVLTFQYINRMVTILLPAHLLPPLLRRPLLGLLGRKLAPIARQRRAAGEALARLPEAAPGPHLTWATGVPTIARAFAALDHAAEVAVAPVLSPAGRERVLRALAAWQGEPPPLGFAWLGPSLDGLSPADAAAVRLALLAALAPHRVGESEIAAFRRHHAGDEPVVAVLSWVSHQAARRISEWL